GREVKAYPRKSMVSNESEVVTAAGRSQGTAGVDPDVLDARNLNHVLLLQNPVAVLSASNVQVVHYVVICSVRLHPQTR
ncbi:hypothetical protein KI387_033724, partial [Taxus chinensis]